MFYRATLWKTDESTGRQHDHRRIAPAARRSAIRRRAAWLYRALEIPPDTGNKSAHVEAITKLNSQVQQAHAPTAQDLARHPSMHRTDTLDCITCVIGEIWMVTDVDEVLMKPGDSVIIRGTNHAWSNRSDKPRVAGGLHDQRQEIERPV